VNLLAHFTLDRLVLSDPSSFIRRELFVVFQDTLPGCM